jgi:hypothetical protein
MNFPVLMQIDTKNTHQIGVATFKHENVYNMIYGRSENLTSTEADRLTSKGGVPQAISINFGTFFADWPFVFGGKGGLACPDSAGLHLPSRL